jgi:UDP-glucose 4-epimerase
MKILVTGSAGFIGYHLSKKLIERGDTVIGADFLLILQILITTLEMNQHLNQRKTLFLKSLLY